MTDQDESSHNESKNSDGEISFAGESDQDYDEEAEIEEESDDDYVAEYEDEIEDDYTSENSEEKHTHRKKSQKLSKSTLRRIHRPALKTKQTKRSRRFDDSSSSTSSSQFDQSQIADLDEESAESDEFGDEKFTNENETNGNSVNNCELIEKIIKHRMGIKGEIGSETTIYADSKKEKIPDDSPKEFELQLLIKWKNWSYLHSTWENMESLKSPSILGFKKAENYVKKIKQQKTDPDISSDNEFIEFINDTNFDDFTTVDRVIASRVDQECDTKMEYFCKWKSLGYDECTWESEDVILPRYSAAIDSYNIRSNIRLPQFDQRHNRCKTYNREVFCANFHKISSHPKTQNSNSELLKEESLKLTLRDYQEEGVKWLVHSWFVGNSVILADEMGLGKTVQIIKYIDCLISEFLILGPFLIIVPLTTLDSWMKHFNIWAPCINVIPFIGNAKSRENIYNYEMFDSGDNNDLLKFNVLITTYELVLKESNFFASIEWASMIIDEGHRLKNDNSQLYQALYDFNSYHRILMTGTPLQNSIKELWCLLHFVMPDRFSDYSEIECYNNYQNYENGLDELQALISEYMLRRTKKDVEKSLPPKLEQILRVDMTMVQKQYYRWILTKNYRELSKEGKGNITGFLNILMELKKCCNHAALVCPDADIHTANNNDSKEEIKILLNGSGKLILLDKLLTRLAETKSRVLIFSQMVHMLDILSDYLTMKKFGFQRLDGSMNESTRIRAIDHFNAPDSTDFCFLLSTKAGGLGINLVTADTVIIYDSDWNPQNDLQAQARAHRIGQTKQVKIYRLVTKNSIEEDIVERAKRKMVLDHLIIQTMDSKSSTSLVNKNSARNINFSSDELSLILKFGAGELFKENLDHGQEEPLQELDLDSIIKLAEQPYDNASKALSRGEEFLSSFKVANFKTTDAEENYFAEGLKWENIIPASEIEKMETERLLDEEAKLCLPPRRPMNIQNLDAVNYVSDRESNSSENERLFSKNNNRKRSYTVEGLNSKEIKRFVNEMKKYPHPFSRVEHICTVADLVKKDHPNKLTGYKKLSEILEGLVIRLNSKKSVKKNSNVKSTNEIKINSVMVDLTDICSSRNTVDPFGDAVESFFKLLPTEKLNENFIKSNFFINIKTNKPKWNPKWTKLDDALLIAGIYYHGLKNWNKLIMDSTLNLKSKLKHKNGKLVPTKSLMARVLYLSNLIKTQPSYTLSMVLKNLKLSSPVKSSSKPKEHSEKLPSNVKKSNKPIKRKQAAAKTPPSKKTKTSTHAPVAEPIKSDTVLDAETTKICVNVMKPAKLNISHIECSKPDEMMEYKKDIKVVGRLIESYSRKNIKNINSEILWHFVSKFTFISSQQLKDFYKANFSS